MTYSNSHFIQPSSAGFSFYVQAIFSACERVAHSLFGGKINTNISPNVPGELALHQTIKFGTVAWDKKAFANSLFSFDEDTIIKSMTYKDLITELTCMPVANAALFDWLLKHPSEIPLTAWEGKKIMFFGTLFVDRAGSLFVRYITCRNHDYSYGVCSLNDVPDYKVCALLVP